MKIKGYSIELDINGHPDYDGFYKTYREASAAIKTLGYIWPAKVKEVTLIIKKG